MLNACEPAAEPCSGAALTVNPAALNFGDVRRRAPEDPGDPTTRDQVPSRRVLLIENTCTPPLALSEICIVLDAHNGVEGNPAFFLEPPERLTVRVGEPAALRITYDHVDPNEDRDADGFRDVDRALLVIQSNATNAPTQVVPLCGRILGDADEVDTQPCPAPFTIPPGERIADLCDR